MFDFLAHWFAKTEIIKNENGEASEKKKSYFRNGHFSLDLTFICLFLVIVICYFAYQRYKKYNKKSFAKMYHLQTIRCQSNVERAPLEAESQKTEQ